MLKKCNYYLLTLTAFYLECSVFDLFLITDTLYLLQQQNVKDDASTHVQKNAAGNIICLSTDNANMLDNIYKNETQQPQTSGRKRKMG